MSDAFPSISSIIGDIKLGDEEKWARLVNLFESGLLGKARTLLRNTKVARRVSPEDLVSETWKKAWLKRQQLEAESTRQVAAFLITTLRNTFIDQTRPKNLEDTITQSWIMHAAGDDQSPSQVVMGVEQESRLHACLAELPDNQRQVLVLRHFDGLKFREIAEALDITTGAAAGLARDGLRNLSKSFDTPGDAPN